MNPDDDSQIDRNNRDEERQKWSLWADGLSFLAQGGLEVIAWIFGGIVRVVAAVVAAIASS